MGYVVLDCDEHDGELCSDLEYKKKKKKKNMGNHHKLYKSHFFWKAKFKF